MLQADAELARREKRWDAALESSLDTVQLGHRIDDGSLVHGLVGVAIEAMAHSMLSELRVDLNEQQRQRLVAALSHADQYATPYAAILAADRAWPNANMDGACNCTAPCQRQFKMRNRDRLRYPGDYTNRYATPNVDHRRSPTEFSSGKRTIPRRLVRACAVTNPATRSMFAYWFRVPIPKTRRRIPAVQRGRRW